MELAKYIQFQKEIQLNHQVLNIQSKTNQIISLIILDILFKIKPYQK